MRFDPENDIELNPSEYWHENKPVPFWGDNALSLLGYLILAYPSYLVAKTVVEFAGHLFGIPYFQ